MGLAGFAGGVAEHLQGGVKVSSHAVLPRTHVDLPDHAHLQVLGRSDVAVPEVGAGVGREVVVGEAAADVDGDRRVGHAVVERRRVRISVEVNRVLLEQVRPHDLAHVGEGEKELVVLVDGHQRPGNVAVQRADVHDRASIDVTGEAVARSTAVGADRIVAAVERWLGIGGQADRAD